MDAFARGLKAAAAIRADGRIAEFVANRYATWNSGIGAKIEGKSATLEEVAAHALKSPEPVIASGRQELLKNIINEFI
jgi:xylose isomerase